MNVYKVTLGSGVWIIIRAESPKAANSKVRDEYGYEVAHVKFLRKG